jgi:hypothetical protein
MIMRRPLSTVAAAGLLLAAPAWAQTEDQDEGAAGMEGSSTVESPPKTGSEPAPKEAPNASHTVERGDTLWDLSRKYLGSPWYWPKVWSYNPAIANPHWIYPGNNVRFYGAEDQPSQVEVGTEVPDVEQGAMVDDEGVTVAGTILFRPKDAYRASVPGFVTVKELEESPRIMGSFREETFITAPGTVYVDVSAKKSLKVGDSCVIFRDGGEVFHPATNEFYGYLTRIVAEGRVLAIDTKKNVATLALTHSFFEVTRGDSVSPAGESVVRSVAPRTNEREVKGGTLIKSVNGTGAPGEAFFVIIDRGADDGVKVGNFFTISRSGDMGDTQRFFNPNANDPAFPREAVGRCIAMDVKSKATTCLVTNSLRELAIGDEAMVQMPSARTASR